MTISDVLEGIPYARFIGMTVREEDGGVLTLMRFRDEIVGNRRLPAIHGGVVGAFIEMAAIIELAYEMGSERFPKPISFNVNYLRSAGPIDCIAKGEVVKLGKRIAHVRVVGWQDDPQRPFASGYGNFLV
jgi:uncharacterized protein (TIGR00369 family)